MTVCRTAHPPLDPDERAGLKLRHVTRRGELNELEQAMRQQAFQQQ